MTTKQKFEEGLYDISIEAYHDAEGFSRTQLLAFNKSPYHFWYEHLSGIAEKKEPTDAMRMGSAIHTLLLQPELFKKEYAILPLLDRRTTKGKETYAAFMEENTGKIILSYEQYEKIISIITNVQRHEIVSNLLHGARHEQSIFWTDKETGLQFKVRPDSWLGNMIVDLKTAKDSNIHRFKYTALSNGYYLQAGMIYEACKAIGKPIELFTLLVIEKDEPNVPSVFTMSDESLDFGVEQFNQYKRQLKKCMDLNKWPGYLVQELNVPNFSMLNGAYDE